ncbi:MAG: thioredoxin [bacterium]
MNNILKLFGVTLVIFCWACQPQKESVPQSAGSSKVVVLNGKNFKQNVLETKGTVLVDFYADWCPPCRMQKPIIEELAEELEGKVIIANVNVDNNQDLAAQYQVRSIPTLIIYNDGKLEKKLMGYHEKEQLREYLSPYIK